MRGLDARQTTMFNFIAVEDRIPPSHPLREVRTVANEVLLSLAPKLTLVYAREGRAALPGEHLLRTLLLWALYGVPSERRLLEELDYNLLFRWFVGLGMEDEVWPRTTFAANRRRLLSCGIAGEFFARTLVRLPGRVVHNDHFNLNWSLLEEWSGQMRLRCSDDREDEADTQSDPAGS
jgi:transposase